MVARHGLESYQDIQIKTLDPGKLIVLLYEKLEENLQLAASRLEAGDMIGKGEAIQKSQDIILELLTSLNLDAGKIAKDLQALYLFMFRDLNRINLEKDSVALEKILKSVQNLKEAWVEITSRPVVENRSSTLAGKTTSSSVAVMA